MSKRSIFDYRIYYKRYLPHIQPKDSVLFITYCLDFKYPKWLYYELKRRKQVFEKSINNIREKEKRIRIYNFNKQQFDYFDNFIIKYKKSPDWLKNSEIAEKVIENLFFWNTKRYNLICYCIMPNHVHILIKPLLKNQDTPFSVTEIIKSHKSYTGKEANKLLVRKGAFWHCGFYDHYIRDNREFFNVIRYILHNPVKGGLIENYEDWKYSWVDEKVLQL